MSAIPAIHRDTFFLVAGRELGRGISRVVYACDINPDWVVKVEEDAGRFQNIVEWKIWQEAKDLPARRWLAPCLYISPNGSVLIQARTTPARPREYSDRMPAFLTDFKRLNYGMIGRRLVCHDYGTSLVLHEGLSTKLRRAEWWDS